MKSAPVTLGARRARRANVGGLALADLHFPPDLRLPPHAHDRMTVAVVLSGGFDGWWNGREGPCAPGTLLVEPAGERHANRFGPRAGTRVVIVQPDGGLPGIPPIRSGRPSPRFDALPLAWRMGEELRNPDTVTPVALEGLALELMALAARDQARTIASRWPALAAEIVEERYAQPITLSSLAAELGMHPSYVARGFRQHHGRSVGSYLREVRVRRATERLVAGTEPVADIALAVGFSDQSHLTRWFARYRGVTPARYRRLLRGG